ncbi:MAG TPA: hypothetical protein VGG35_08390 [Streptosporangiaceae bacterium]|jgi:hypothetical protein
MTTADTPGGRPADVRARAGGRRLRLSRLLPGDVMTFRGPRWTAGMLAAVNAVGTIRSLVHVLAPDSGAQSIASMDTGVKGGGNVIGLLGQWGGAQLLEAGVIWVALGRYRGLVPLMLGVVTAEQALRVGIGSAKPLTTARTPPGALSKVLLPAVAVALAMSLTENPREGA